MIGRAAIGLLLLLALPARAGVVSLNLCSDELLVLLAPQRVLALSVLARDPALSVVAERAAGLPWVRAEAEAVLALRPELVLAGPFGATAAVAALERRGVRVERVSMPADFDGIRVETRRVAALLGAVAAGEALLAEMDRELASVAKGDGAEAVALAARGYVPGAASLEGAVLRAAGYLVSGLAGHVSLEGLLAHRPDVLVTAEAPAFPSLATDLVRHPALAGIRRRAWAPALMACGGPWTARAVSMVAP